MTQKVTPMIHVPDVRSTVEWYREIGFDVVATYGDDGDVSDELSFAVVGFGSTYVMFNEGGKPSYTERREVDLYVYANQVDAIFDRLKDRVDVIAEPHRTFYGAWEFIIRDLNGFWISFGQTGS